VTLSPNQRRYVDDYFFSRAYRGLYDGLYRSKGKLDMTEYYKGQRISELLARIKILQNALEEGRGEITTAEGLVEFIEGEATLAIMKAKLTALQGTT
jgi:hypothetical protein